MSRNPGWLPAQASVAPDGDVDLEADYSRFEVPPCPRCGGILKPEVVFFGEGVPRRRTVRAFQKLEQSDALLIVGSSLMVWSGFRFARRAAELGLPMAAVNLGRTRADDLLQLKVTSRAGDALPGAID
jgi:NAD-dependent SIR2 family protein deacetylase